MEISRWRGGFAAGHRFADTSPHGHGPCDADERLLVADGEISPREKVEQLSIAPEVLPVVPSGPTRLQDQHAGLIGYDELLRRPREIGVTSPPSGSCR